MSLKAVEKGVKLPETLTVQQNHAPSDGDCEPEDEEVLALRDHPLFNDLILETLFGFVRRFDLKACRVVSKKWNLHTIPHMRAKFQVTIHGSQPDTKRGQDNRRVEHFVQLFSFNELGIPFSKFRLGPFRTADGVGQQFLQFCGETATEIKLNELNGGKSEVYTVEDVSELLRSCPNIKVLAMPFNPISRSGNIVKLFPGTIPTFSSLKQIVFWPHYEKDRLKYCRTSIEELMTAAPNITDITASDHTEEDVEGNPNEKEGRSDISAVLNAITKLEIESSIQSLFLKCAKVDNIEHLKKMRKKGLKLNSLYLEPTESINDDLEFDAIQIELATCFRDSLEYLNVGGTYNILMEFPNMPKLRSLSLQVCYDFDPKPVDLNVNFPALWELEISFLDDDEENWDDFFREFEVCPTLKSLIVKDKDMKIHTFHDVLRVFPNLTKLSFHVVDDCLEILRRIWSQMTGLESLTIQGYIERKGKDFLDSLFTGIPSRALKRITDDVNSLDRMTVQRRRDTIENLQNDESRLPSLRNLTKLRHLNLDVRGLETSHYWHQTKEIHLTDLTAYLALYSMKQLRHVDIQQCEFTNTCCEILTKETGLESWSFRKKVLSYQLNIIPPFVLPERENHYNYN